MSNSEQGEKFWAFSLAVYARPEVESACLRLQFDHGLDVNAVLFCAWTGGLGISLDKSTLEEQIAAALEWQELAVQPIRVIRRRLKNLNVAGLSTSGRDDLRQSIKAAELEAEKLEQSILVQMIAGLPEGVPSAALADANFDAYWRFAGQGDHLVALEAWQIIRAAAFSPETRASA
jgi:uncharacterized protein (TIGR02444 family)